MVREEPPQLSILLVDDDAELGEKLIRRLRSAFPTAVLQFAQNSIEAFQKLQEQPFDVLVIDIMLEGDKVPSGLDIIRHLKRQDLYLFRSIAYTGYSQESDIGFRVGKVGFDVIIKKDKMEDLVDAIYDQVELLEKQRATSIGSLFCMMPFHADFDDVYIFGIKNAAQELGFKCERNDEKVFTNDVLTEIQKNIMEADLIVADLSNGNANVYYEVGYAHALGKDVVLLVQFEEDLKFDLRSMRCIVYNGSIRTLYEELKKTLIELSK